MNQPPIEANKKPLYYQIENFTKRRNQGSANKI